MPWGRGAAVSQGRIVGSRSKQRNTNRARALRPAAGAPARAGLLSMTQVPGMFSAPGGWRAEGNGHAALQYDTGHAPAQQGVRTRAGLMRFPVRARGCTRHGRVGTRPTPTPTRRAPAGSRDFSRQAPPTATAHTRTHNPCAPGCNGAEVGTDPSPQAVAEGGPSRPPPAAGRIRVDCGVDGRIGARHVRVDTPATAGCRSRIAGDGRSPALSPHPGRFVVISRATLCLTSIAPA